MKHILPLFAAAIISAAAFPDSAGATDRVSAVRSLCVQQVVQSVRSHSYSQQFVQPVRQIQYAQPVVQQIQRIEYAQPVVQQVRVQKFVQPVVQRVRVKSAGGFSRIRSRSVIRTRGVGGFGRSRLSIRAPFFRLRVR